jgi:large subunit ribosomal protein L32
MAVPRNRHSNARKNSKRSHHAKKKIQLGACKECGQRTVPHAACPACGKYAGRQVAAAAE